MKEPRDAYKVLQVDPEADLEVIQAAYRRLAQKYHPDRVEAGGDSEAAAVRMVEINAAWEQIGGPTARAAYDRRRASAPDASRGSSPSPSRGAPQPRASANRGPSTPRAHDPDVPPTHGDAAAGAAFRRSSASVNSTHSRGEAPVTAGPPPGRPSGSVLNFGRYSGWSLGEVSRNDPGYLEWLDRTPIGRPYRAELDSILRTLGLRVSEHVVTPERHGLFRRR